MQTNPLSDKPKNNELTKAQIRAWIESAIEKARNPDPKELLKRQRRERAKKVIKRFGF